MENPLSWVDAFERIGISGALLTLLVLTGRYYLAPLFASHMELVRKLGEAIDVQRKVQDRQTELLEKIVEEEHAEKLLMKEAVDGIGKLQRSDPSS